MSAASCLSVSRLVTHPLVAPKRRRARAMMDALEPRRLLAAGMLDTSFSQDGKAAITASDGSVLSVEDVAVQADGKVVVVGTSQPNATSDDRRVAVARFNFDGSPDTTFGTGGNGLVRFRIGNQQSDRGTCVAIQGDGKIVVGAASFQRDFVFGGAQFGVARLNPNGSLDTTFDGDGKRTIEFDSFTFATDIVLQSVNTASGIVQKIVVVGGSTDFAIARLNPNGLLDGTFSGDGKQEIGFGFNETARGVAIDTQNRIVIAGYSSNSGGSAAVVTRLIGSNGAKDTTFGTSGEARATFPGQPDFTAGAILLQSENKIVVVGTLGGGDVGMVRFLSTGQIDRSFGPGQTGFVSTDLGGVDFAYDAITSADGSFTVAGQSDGRFALARYSANGVLQSSFGTGGKIFGEFTGAGGLTNEGVAIARGPGRRFVIAGAGMGAARFLDTGANGVAVSATDSLAVEGSTNTATLFVGRTERLPSQTTVFFDVTGTATRPPGSTFSVADYTITNMTTKNRDGTPVARPFVIIPPNETFVLCTITAVDDTALEGPQTAIFTPVPDANYEIGTPSSGQITIGDNDQPPVLNFAPTADAFVRDGASATTNFGAATELQVKTATVGLNREAFVKFDVRTISSVGSAKLQVFARLNSTENASLETSVFGSPDTSWNETAITFNNRPSFASPALFTRTIAGTTLKLYEFDVTAFLLKERSLKHDVVTFVLKNPTTSNSVVLVNSREAASGRPNLLINASPDVGTFKLTSQRATTSVGTSTNLALQWDVPEGSWHQLTKIQLRLRGSRGASILIEWDEAENTLALFDPVTKRFGEPMNIGTDGVLSNKFVSVSLKRSTVVASGPTSNRVTVTFSLQFKQSNQRWKIDTSASNDLGTQQRFERAGRLIVR